MPKFLCNQRSVLYMPLLNRPDFRLLSCYRKLARFQMIPFFIHCMLVSTSHQTETQQVHVFCYEGHSTLWFWRFTLNQTTEQW